MGAGGGKGKCWRSVGEPRLEAGCVAPWSMEQSGCRMEEARELVCFCSVLVGKMCRESGWW